MQSPTAAPRIPGLGERRVDAAVGAEAVEQPGGRAEDAAGAPDVLADHHHVRVALELGVQRVVDRLDERQLSHVRMFPRRIDVSVREEQLRVGGRLGLGGGDARRA